MALQQAPYLDPRYGAMPSSSSSSAQYPIYVQPEFFEQQASRMLTQGVPPPRSAASSSGYAPLPPPAPPASPGFDVAEDLARMMDEEAQQQQALVAAPQPPQRRNVMTTMRNIFDPAAATSPNEQVRRYIDEKAAAVWNSQQELEDMINDMLRQLSKQTTKKMQASAALNAIERRLKPLNVDPKDIDNLNLVITYYVLRNLLTRLNMPLSTDVVSLVRR